MTSRAAFGRRGRQEAGVFISRSRLGHISSTKSANIRIDFVFDERGYRYILLEAGHIGQNMYLVSTALGLKCCALGGTRDQNLEKLLDIDGVTESVVYAVAAGR